MNHISRLTMRNIGGDAIKITGPVPSFGEIDLENIGGNGLVIDAGGGLIQQLGLPSDTSAAELGDLLRKLKSLPDSDQETALIQSSMFQRWRAGGLDASSILANILTIVQAGPLYAAALGSLGISV